MAKIEIDILDTALNDSEFHIMSVRETSGDGDNEMLGMVDEGSFGSGGDDKSQLTTQSFLDSGEDDAYNNYDSCSKLGVSAVTYRVVHVESEDMDNTNSTVATGPIYNTPGGATIEKTGSQPISTVLANTVNGQLYVFGGSNNVYVGPGSKNLVQRESTKGIAGGKKRDDRRRATHNEVERRRRDKINNWIMRLSKIIPNNQDDKVGLESQSKGGILAKACEYIQELKADQIKHTELLKDNELMAVEIIKLNQQVSNLKRENSAIVQKLLQNGIDPNIDPKNGS